MNIDEAIEILKERKKGRRSIGQFDDVKALQLGIEALKCIKVLRIIPHKRLNLELPDETED